ncbi:uncharacterized protein [Oscarella lobularis]
MQRRPVFWQLVLRLPLLSASIPNPVEEGEASGCIEKNETVGVGTGTLTNATELMRCCKGADVHRIDWTFVNGSKLPRECSAKSAFCSDYKSSLSKRLNVSKTFLTAKNAEKFIFKCEIHSFDGIKAHYLTVIFQEPTTDLVQTPTTERKLANKRTHGASSKRTPTTPPRRSFPATRNVHETENKASTVTSNVTEDNISIDKPEKRILNKKGTETGFSTVTVTPNVTEEMMSRSSSNRVFVALGTTVGFAAIVIASIAFIKRSSFLRKTTTIPFCDQEPLETVWNGKDFRIPLSCLLTSQKLGEGHFGSVVAGKMTVLRDNSATTKQVEVAVKMLKNLDSENVKDSLRKETDVAINLGYHDNVVHVYGYCSENEVVSRIVMEYADHGNLRDYLRSQRSVDSTSSEMEKRAQAFGLQIASGMKYVSSKGYVHGDLAARNVLVFKNEVVKISDFGLSKYLGPSDYYRKKTSGGVIPFKWCAPEVLMYRVYNEYSDVWSFGITLWEVATSGGTPYPGIPTEKLFELVTSSTGYKMCKPKHCCQDLYEVMVRCWDENPARRPDFAAIVQTIEGMVEKHEKVVNDP